MVLYLGAEQPRGLLAIALLLVITPIGAAIILGFAVYWVVDKIKDRHAKRQHEWAGRVIH